MIKYFHELTKEEFTELVEKKLMWKECAKLYPQPDWCNYPDAVCGIMGCWSLMNLSVTEENCANCDCYQKVSNDL